MLICGVDEAGRGCIIGPLVICGAVIREGQDEELRRLGVKDSKQLKPEDRERLYGELLKLIEAYHIIQISAEEIDGAVTSDGDNLNWLEGAKTSEIIGFLKPQRAIVDCPSPNVKAYKTFLVSRIANKKLQLLAEHKADINHVVVSAASILAKVTRDRAIKTLKDKIGIDFGSGYCSDPVTARFLDDHWATYPELFRHSWAPYQKKLVSASQTLLTRY